MPIKISPDTFGPLSLTHADDQFEYIKARKTIQMPLCDLINNALRGAPISAGEEQHSYTVSYRVVTDFKQTTD